jgi:hypothetical protein
VEVFGYPVQIGKIQPPLLPEETLRRDRLLDRGAAFARLPPQHLWAWPRLHILPPVGDPSWPGASLRPGGPKARADRHEL